MAERTATAESPEILSQVPERPADEEPPLRPDASTRSPRKEIVAEKPSRSDDHSPASLEQRVRRLEDSLAQLQDTQALEARIARQILERMQRERIAAGGVRESAALVIDAGRQLLPAAVGALHAHATAVEAQARTSPPPERRSWMIVELFADLRTLIRMFRDPQYRAIWLRRMLLPLILLAAILTSSIWLYVLPLFPLLPDMVTGLIVKMVDLLLAVVLYKALQREIRRYRETIPEPSLARRS